MHAQFLDLGIETFSGEAFGGLVFFQSTAQHSIFSHYPHCNALYGDLPCIFRVGEHSLKGLLCGSEDANKDTPEEMDG